MPSIFELLSRRSVIVGRPLSLAARFISSCGLSPTLNGKGRITRFLGNILTLSVASCLYLAVFKVFHEDQLFQVTTMTQVSLLELFLYKMSFVWSFHQDAPWV